MDPVTRRKMLHRIGLVEALPTVALQRYWALIDDRIPPEGDADGEFITFIQWVNKASSWIGFTGSKCFDTLDRPCRNGGDMARARDEGAFPVRWYSPDRFATPTVPLSKPEISSMEQLLNAEGHYLPARSIRSATGKAPVRRSTLTALEAGGFIASQADGYVVTEYGVSEFPFEMHRIRQASYVRPY